MKKELLESCAAMYRTPAYIFDTDCFRQTIRNLRDSLGKDVGLCYAMKANPFLADRRYVPWENFRFAARNGSSRRRC